MANKTVQLIIFILTVSTLFPMVGYFLDWRHKRKMAKGAGPEAKKAAE